MCLCAGWPRGTQSCDLFCSNFISFIMYNIHHNKRMNESTIKTLNTKWQEKRKTQQWRLENETVNNVDDLITILKYHASFWTYGGVLICPELLIFVMLALLRCWADRKDWNKTWLTTRPGVWFRCCWATRKRSVRALSRLWQVLTSAWTSLSKLCCQCWKIPMHWRRCAVNQIKWMPYQITLSWLIWNLQKTVESNSASPFQENTVHKQLPAYSPSTWTQQWSPVQTT